MARQQSLPRQSASDGGSMGRLLHVIRAGLAVEPGLGFHLQTSNGCTDASIGPAGGIMGKGVAVVTGGTAGLGRAIVRELAERGWDVGILARGEDGLEGAAADVRAAGARALAVPTDVADRVAVESAADRIED